MLCCAPPPTFGLHILSHVSFVRGACTSYAADDIESKVSDLRTKLLRKLEEGGDIGGRDMKNTHNINAAKEVENERLRKAFGLSEDRVEGASFKNIGGPVTISIVIAAAVAVVARCLGLCRGEPSPHTVGTCCCNSFIVPSYLLF